MSNQFNEKNWVKTGLGLGAFVFPIMTFVYPYFTEQDITLTSILINLIICTIAGLGFGYTMKIFMNKKEKK